MNDIELKEYFHQNRPQTSDETTYLAGLSARMDAVSQIKRLHEESIRKYRRIFFLTFVISGILGMAVSAFIILKPVSLPKLNTDILVSLSSFADQWKYAIIIAVVAVSLVLGLIPWKTGLDESPIK